MVPVTAQNLLDVGQTPRVLVVEDDQDLRDQLRLDLEDQGFVLSVASTGATALEALARDRPDVVLLDLGLPDMSGLDLLGTFRRLGDQVIIVISGRGGEVDRCVGLENGADDYLVKPVSIRELVIRTNRLLGRDRDHQEATLEFGALAIDVVTREVFVHGVEVELTAKEFDLLVLLAKEPKRVFGREQILNQVWSSSTSWQQSATISEHVHRLRRKLDPQDRERWINTVRGAGYRFKP